VHDTPSESVPGFVCDVRHPSGRCFVPGPSAGLAVTAPLVAPLCARHAVGAGARVRLWRPAHLGPVFRARQLAAVRA